MRPPENNTYLYETEEMADLFVTTAVVTENFLEQ